MKSTLIKQFENKLNSVAETLEKLKKHDKRLAQTFVDVIGENIEDYLWNELHLIELFLDRAIYKEEGEEE